MSTRYMHKDPIIMDFIRTLVFELLGMVEKDYVRTKAIIDEARSEMKDSTIDHKRGFDLDDAHFMTDMTNIRKDIMADVRAREAFTRFVYNKCSAYLAVLPSGLRQMLITMSSPEPRQGRLLYELLKSNLGESLHEHITVFAMGYRIGQGSDKRYHDDRYEKDGMK